jgi:hypothetical protein
MTIAGDMQIIIRKSENARFTTRRLDGVLRGFVEQKIYKTIPLPVTEMTPSTPITKPSNPCHSGFNGGN